MKKKIVLIVVLVLAILAGAGGYYAYNQHQQEVYHNTYLEMNGEAYLRELTELDLSGSDNLDLEKLPELTKLQSLDLRDTGLTIQQYEQLQAAMPNCDIQWDLPFQGSYLALDTAELTLTTLTQEDLENLAYLENLSKINAEEFTDLEMLMTLKEAYPALEISYNVPVAGQTLAHTATELNVIDGDPAELMTQLKYLPEMTQVIFKGVMPDSEAVYQLKVAYPEVKFVWSFTLFGQDVTSETTELDLSGIQMESVDEIENALKYFNNLQYVDMCDTGLSSEEIDGMWKRHPETRFVWRVRIGTFTIRTDATYLMPYQYGYSATKLYSSEATELKYLVDLICLDVGHMGITDLSFLEFMPNMQYLLIGDTGATDLTPLKYLKKLEFFEGFRNGITDISALAECESLTAVNLCLNSISDISPLFELENLEYIWLAEMQVTIPEEQKQQLAELFPDAKIVYKSASSTGNGWRQTPGYYEHRDILGMWYMYEA